MIPLSFLLIPFGIFAAAILVYGLLTTWALYRFGGDAGAFAATFIFWAGCTLVLFFTFISLIGVDWNVPLLQISTFTFSSGI